MIRSLFIDYQTLCCGEGNQQTHHLSFGFVHFKITKLLHKQLLLLKAGARGRGKDGQGYLYWGG